MVIIKPDVVLRRYACARVLDELRELGTITRFGKANPDPEQVEEHYEEYEGEFFFEWLVDYMTAAPSIVLTVEGGDIIGSVRNRLGETFAHEAVPGTLRNEFGIWGGLNGLHASDSPGTARNEIDAWAEYFDRSSPSECGKHVEKTIQKYIDEPMIDVRRCREITRKVTDGACDVETARSRIAELLEKESDAPKGNIYNVSRVVARNAGLERDY